MRVVRTCIRRHLSCGLQSFSYETTGSVEVKRLMRVSSPFGYEVRAILLASLAAAVLMAPAGGEARAQALGAGGVG